MNSRDVRQILALSLSSIFLTVGCSPGLTVQKYAYLIDDTEGLRNERQEIRQLKKAGIEQTGHLSIFDERNAPASEPELVPQPVGETELIIETAKSYIGTPYQYGGMSRIGVDCSGLICLAYQSANKSLPRTSRAMAEYGREVNQQQLKPGHLVFFDANNGQSINHVGMVVSHGMGRTQFIHATSSAGVRIDHLEDPYWNVRFRKGVVPGI